MDRPRKQLTVADVVRFLNRIPNRDAPIFCSVSLVNLDEPVETQEFILDEERRPCVAIGAESTGITFGYTETDKTIL